MIKVLEIIVAIYFVVFVIILFKMMLCKDEVLRIISNVWKVNNFNSVLNRLKACYIFIATSLLWPVAVINGIVEAVKGMKDENK